jgi:alpha-galactosidase
VAEIWHDAAAGAWLAEMRSTSYAFGLADDGAAVRHLHWGAPLPRAALPGLLASGTGELPRHELQLSMAPRERPDEYVPWGGLRFDEPSVKAEFGDGTRGIEWRFAGQRVSRQGPAVTLEVDLADTVYPLHVTLAYRVYDGFDVLDRWATLRHAGAKHDGGGPPVVIRQAHSANWWLPVRDRFRLRYLHGGWGAETQLAQATLTPGKLVLESRRGTTSHQLNPWFTLDPDGSATEEDGELWSGALAWSGSWKLVFETTAGGRVHACGGVNDFDWCFSLSPGDELVLPRFAGLYTTEGFGAASREWHAWQLAHVLGRGDDRASVAAPGRASPAPAASAPAPPSLGPASSSTGRGEVPLRPVLYNSWEATSFDVNEAGQTRLAELAARLGIETFVMDDGWFGERHHDRAGLGDWTVSAQKFPRGLGPLIDRVNALGMRFGLWAEPEMVNPDSDLYRAHPDWVYHFDGRTRSEQRNQLVLNLARPDVADWMFGTLDRLLSQNRIEFVKWDMNRSFSEPGWPEAFLAGDNPERAWTDYVSNLYAVLDALRAAHPGVEFESCASGGGRVDLGILRRVEQVWTSDNTDAWDRVKIQEGFTQAYPPQAMMAWVTDSPNYLTRRELPLSFRFHVAMAGALGVGGDLLRWTDAELAEAAELIAAYKDIRPVIQRGRLYRLASVLDAPFGASQYLAGDDVVLLGWWGPQPGGARPSRVRLAGLDAGARYRDVASGERHWGAALLAEGLLLPEETASTFGSTLVHLVRQPAAR